MTTNNADQPRPNVSIRAFTAKPRPPISEIALPKNIDTFGLGWYALLVVISILYFIMCIFVGNSIAIPVCVPIVVTMMASLGMESQVAMAALLLTYVGGLGKSLTPFEPKYLYISELCGDYETMDLVKRNSVPIIFTFIISLVGTIVCYGVLA